MRKYNYWKEKEHLNYSRRFNKFNTIFESIMSDIPLFDKSLYDDTVFIRHPDLNLILEEIAKPQYVVLESTR